MISDKIREAVAKAREQLAARSAGKPVAKAQIASAVAAAVILLVPQIASTPLIPINSWKWNSEQTQAITNGVVGKSFVLIGAAGTGKTTTLKGLLQEVLQSGSVPLLISSTKNLDINSPGIVLVSYTRRAVRNIAKQMPKELRSHCMTIHKLIEFAPEIYYETNEMGAEVKKTRFSPQRNRQNPLPAEITKVVIDESSMVDLALFDKLWDALPNPYSVQFIFLGDLNQLPPVYGHPILGQKLLQLPIVELTQVYRQALESPIIALALSVKNNNFMQFNKDAVELWSGDKFKKPDGTWNHLAFDAKEVNEVTTLEMPGRGKVTLHPWKKRLDTELGLTAMKGQLKSWIEKGVYNPDEDLVLCPWNKSFGALELNKAIADKLGKMREAYIYEIIAGFETVYYAVGDKLLVDKQDAIILEINKNPKYFGKHTRAPSQTIDRWGNSTTKDVVYEDFEDYDVDDMLAELGDVSDRSAQASHTIRVRLLDTEEIVTLSRSAEFNGSSFGYAMTVHKAQGSECRKVFFITHHCHSAMLFRELVYTAATRAAEELYIVMSPMMLTKAAKSPRIKGDTLAAKLEFYTERLKERIASEGEYVG